MFRVFLWLSGCMGFVFPVFGVVACYGMEFVCSYLEVFVVVIVVYDSYGVVYAMLVCLRIV